MDLDELVRVISAAQEGQRRITQRPGLLEAARLLRTSGVTMPIVLGETKGDHAIRFAIAFAEKLEKLAAAE